MTARPATSAHLAFLQHLTPAERDAVSICRKRLATIHNAGRAGQLLPIQVADRWKRALRSLEDASEGSPSLDGYLEHQWERRLRYRESTGLDLRRRHVNRRSA